MDAPQILCLDGKTSDFGALSFSFFVGYLMILFDSHLVNEEAFCRFNSMPSVSLKYSEASNFIVSVSFFHDCLSSVSETINLEILI